MAENDSKQQNSSGQNQNALNPAADVMRHETHQRVVVASSRSDFIVPLIVSGVLIFLIALLSLVYFLPIGNSGVQVTLAEKNNAIALLEKRRDELKIALDGFSCPMPSITQQSRAGGGSTGNGTSRGGDNVISAIDPNQPLPEISGALSLPSSGPIVHAEKATVLIVAEDTSDDGANMGSGFFINETDILTNLHVVGDTRNVKIINKELGKLLDAKVIARSRGEAQIGAPDFAILRISGARAPAILAIAGKTAKGESVIAAGFPGVIMETDSVFHRLLEGDMTAAPEMAVTQGMVTTFQQGLEGLELMLHTAAISGGNSGGPLIDYCGRAVGVNTFLRSGSMQSSPLSFAQRTSTLASFLTRANVAFKFDDTQCNPQATPPHAAGPISNQPQNAQSGETVINNITPNSDVSNQDSPQSSQTNGQSINQQGNAQ